MDAGTAFGGMAASRSITLASLSEPALLIVVFVLALLAGSSNLDLVAAMQLESGMDWRVDVVLAFAATLLVALVDCHHARMRRVMMTVEFGGRDLALMNATDALRVLLWFNLIGTMFLPFGIGPAGASPVAWLPGLACWFFRTLLLTVVLAVLPAVFGRTRSLRASRMVGVAVLLGLLAAAFMFADWRTA
jgi:formate hydrogenlyase subunit 4